MTIKKARELMDNNELKSSTLVDYYLDNISKENKDLNAYLSVFSDEARREALETDERLSRGENPGVLAGIPIAVKDNILVRGYNATAGSKILENYVASYDATVVRKLKDAGAIILGKTNLDEFAMGSSCEQSAFGPTKNPRNREYVPGGSSGGSACAVAGEFALAALGSDTGGSIRQPASLCGIVGLKPTYGRVSRSGLIALASSLDQIGPMTKNVYDAALLLSVISGHDVNDATTLPGEKFELNEDMFSGNIEGLKIGLPQEYFIEGIDSRVGQIIEKASKDLEARGAKLYPVSLPHTKYGLATYYIILPSEASANLARFDGIRYGYSVARTEQGRSARTEQGRSANNSSDKNMWDIFIDSRSHGFGDEVRRRIILGTFALSSGYYDAYYNKAQLVRALIRRDFIEAFKKVDVLLTPTSPTLPFKFGEKTDDPLAMYLADVYTVSANLAGIPGISLNAGEVEGLPVGLQLLAANKNEDILVKVANAYEQIYNQ